MTREVMTTVVAAIEESIRYSGSDGALRDALELLNEAIAQPVQPADEKWAGKDVSILITYLRERTNFDADLIDRMLAFAINAPQPVQPATSVAASEPPLSGRWHHGGGCLVSGTIRIAQWDCDTNPPVEFCEDMLDWMCETLNAGVNLWEGNTQVNAQPVQPTPDTEIERLALANGFKLKEQPDGTMALNPYVFDFARALLSAQPVPQAEPDMPAICAALGFDPTNHHNAALCPYCTSAKSAQPAQTSDQIGQLEYCENSVSFIHQKMTAYRNAIDEAWAALKAAGVQQNGRINVAIAISQLAQPVQPTSAFPYQQTFDAICAATRIEGGSLAVSVRAFKESWNATGGKPVQPGQEPLAKEMTAHRAAYFMERFKREEKLLGPNEQAALDFVILVLEAQSVRQSPHHEYDKGFSDGWNKCEERQALAQPEQEPVKFLAYGSRFKISYDKRQSSGKIYCIPAELGGRWVALVAAEDDCHLNLLSPPQRQPLVSIAMLIDWKSQVNEIAARTNKAERHIAGAALKQSIADLIAAHGIGDKT